MAEYQSEGVTVPELIPFTLMIFYLVPFLIAAVRNHDLLVPILVANVVLGWTVIGWILVLIVAIAVPVDGTPAKRRT
jgi:hypothetical protein